MREFVTPRWLRRWWLPFLLMAAISVVSGGQPMVPQMKVFSLDKLGHLLVFGLLATAIFRAANPVWSPTARTAVAIGVTALFGLVDELHQSLTPGRFMDIFDWAADVAGAVLAVYVYREWAWYQRWLETAVPARKRQTAQS